VPFLRPLMKSPEQGAATSIHVASSPQLDDTTGLFFANGKVKTSSKLSYDTTVAARLWRVSAALVM